MIVNDIHSTMAGVAKCSPILAPWMRFWGPVRQNFRNLIATIDVNVILYLICHTCRSAHSARGHLLSKSLNIP